MLTPSPGEQRHGPAPACSSLGCNDPSDPFASMSRACHCFGPSQTTSMWVSQGVPPSTRLFTGPHMGPKPMVPTTSREAAQLCSFSLRGETSCLLPSNCNSSSALCYSGSLDAQQAAEGLQHPGATSVTSSLSTSSPQGAAFHHLPEAIATHNLSPSLGSLLLPPALSHHTMTETCPDPRAPQR